MITFTEHAAEVLKTFLAGDPEPSQALRISVSGAKTAPRFDLTLVEHSDRAEDETSVDASGFEVLVRESDLALLEGATVDYVERVNESGFEVRPAWLQNLVHLQDFAKFYNKFCKISQKFTKFEVVKFLKFSKNFSKIS